MSKFFLRLAAGWVSECPGPRDLERALKREWRAVHTAEQDRAHLATLVHEPATRHRPVESPPVPAPSLTPPRRD